MQSYRILLFSVLSMFACLIVAHAQATLTKRFTSPNNPTVGDFFGTNVAIDNNRILIGAELDDTLADDAGFAFLFDAVSGNLLHTFNDPIPGVADLFGIRVAIEGDTVVIGANSDSTNGNDAGQAYIFNAVSGKLLHTLNDPNPELVIALAVQSRSAATRSLSLQSATAFWGVTLGKLFCSM